GTASPGYGRARPRRCRTRPVLAATPSGRRTGHGGSSRRAAPTPRERCVLLSCDLLHLLCSLLGSSLMCSRMFWLYSQHLGRTTSDLVDPATVRSTAPSA